MLRACVAIERAGVPTVAITSTEFVGMARLIARHLGVDGIPLAVYPGVILTDSPAVFERKVAEEVVPALIDGLLDSRGSTVLDEAAEDEHAPTEVVLTGSYDEILDSFTERGWTDGLPIVPPTIERVESFLRYTDRSPDEVLGTLLPASRAATVWNVAVNGVMAGCRPEHLPILLAVVEAVADPIFRIEDAGSTPGWEPMVILSGPLADELGFNSAAGALRVGNRANTSIGRFLRLYMRNVAGLRPQPDQTDKGAISYTFNVALSENESAVQEIGWQPYRLDRGFEPTENVVTVRSVVTISAPIYTAGEHPEDHLETIARLMADAIGPWCYHDYIYEQQHPLLVLGPGIAAAIAAGGMSKDDVRRYLYDNVLIDGAWVAKYAPGVSGKAFDWADLAARGKAPAEYATAATDGRKVRGFLRPEWTDIVVAGNPGRNQSRGYIGNHGQGIPVSRAVALPADWVRLRREHQA
ncbi:MAG: hypothetical protein M3400_13880 [Actinomycetota bacterium]|nr:hypothetical protein [Actinomycetota bacterium]